MASFGSVTESLGCSIAVQRAIARHNAESPDDGARFRVRIGIGAGEPVTEDGDLFRATVQFAERFCDSATAGHICVSEAVRALVIGKRFPFGPVGELTLKCFDGPVRVVGVNWDDAEGV
jgi:adenylate cyclase